MRIIIVEPSVLSRNIYRLLLQQRKGSARISVLESVEELSVEDFADEPPAAMVIGAAALTGAYAKYRGLLTDVALWSATPKLVVTSLSHRDGGRAAWDDWAGTHVVARPFRPENFQTAFDALLKKKS